MTRRRYAKKNNFLGNTKEKQTNFSFNTAQQAPQISSQEWITDQPISNPKVTLVFFWTFGCINCKNVIPYINSWYELYHSKGLEILGIHSPEFSYEREKENVEQEIKKENIKFPVSMDNDFVIWNSFSNKYWPALYFIDSKGHLRHSHFGEGDYKNSEEVIQALLEE